MADLTDLQAAGSVKIVGVDTAGVETNPVGATANNDLKTSDGLSQGGVFGNLNLTTAGTAYEAKVGVSALANRKTLTITALNNGIYWGYDNTVTTSNGSPLSNNQTIIFSIDPNSTFQVWLVGNTNNKDVRLTESP